MAPPEDIPTLEYAVGKIEFDLLTFKENTKFGRCGKGMDLRKCVRRI